MVKFDSFTGDPAFFSNKNWNSGQNTGINLAVQGSNTLDFNTKGDVGVRSDIEPFGALEAGVWQNISFTFDRDGPANLYIDGTLAGQISSGTQGTLDGAFNFRLLNDGTGNYGLGSATNLQIDEFAAWNRLLTIDEVMVLSQATAAFIPGDINQDGVVNLLDVGPFAEIISLADFRMKQTSIRMASSICLTWVRLLMECRLGIQTAIFVLKSVFCGVKSTLSFAAGESTMTQNNSNPGATYLFSIVILLFATSVGSGQLVVTDIDGTALDGLYVYGEGETEDILGIPRFGNPNFWTITTPTDNTLFFETEIDVGLATAVIELTGLESNTDWIFATISGTNGVPTLVYTGGDSANLDFYNGGQWFTGDTITITFEPAVVPEPSSLLIFGFAGLLPCIRRKRCG